MCDLVQTLVNRCLHFLPKIETYNILEYALCGHVSMVYKSEWTKVD